MPASTTQLSIAAATAASCVLACQTHQSRVITSSSEGLDNAPAVPAADPFVLSRLWSKRRINQKGFYLVQWECYEDLTWEPTANLPCELVARFEAANRDSVWDFQSTRGRRRRLGSERPTRRSTRVRGKLKF
ncbi:hypothetical protein PR002_g4330 [Phytophthora rubi]|uniref:Chromo domain-containing protein n=1 Tax=Phytophthora rubi TaxID=129364 RepID=A0A6A3NHK8_9STRA|nr:hypothetical protein PR002_g4330 [Phytophthora rubi]